LTLLIPVPHASFRFLQESLMNTAHPLIQIETTHGEIVLELDAAKAPVSVENFIGYARASHYDGTIFHRVIKGFMIQGGGMTPDLTGRPTGAPIRNEAGNGLKNKTGTVAMARTAEIDSATAQFFINTADNKFLDHGGSRPEVFGYAVFGRVVDGMDVVYTIEQVAIGTRGGNQDLPVDPVVINTVTVID
jgi:peptidyl-prolyl cis-trans isomerase B (cyclophilin B)